MCNVQKASGGMHVRNQGGKNFSNSNGNGNYDKNKCNYCGFKPHNRKDCPAKEKNCNICNLRGHFASVCKKKNEIKAKPSKKVRLNPQI